jgi:hypothetical protein
VPSYVVETFLARCHAGARVAGEARARSAVEELNRDGVQVGFDGVIHIPEDETCFFVFVAGSPAEAARAAQLAELDPVRIVEAVTSRKETTCTDESAPTGAAMRLTSTQTEGGDRR